MSMTQLTLSVSLRDDATFANYFTLENTAVVEALRTTLKGQGESVIYLWGQSGTGRTHLLQALCHAGDDLEKTTAYIPLSDHVWLSPEMLEGMEHYDIICVDDIEAIAGNKAWEEALFHMYNRVRDARKHMVFAGSKPPALSAIQLPDLRSRLGWGLVYHLKPQSDEEKLAALKLRAKNRGMHLPYDVAQFLMNRYSRHMRDLFRALDKLDRASLVDQRRLTIPFVKEVLML